MWMLLIKYVLGRNSLAKLIPLQNYNWFEFKVFLYLDQLYLVEGDLKASFSIASTPRCREGYYSIPWIASLYPWSIPYNADCLVREHQVAFFEYLVWLDLGLNPSLPDHWQTLYSLDHVWSRLNSPVYLAIYL